MRAHSEMQSHRHRRRNMPIAQPRPRRKYRATRNVRALEILTKNLPRPAQFLRPNIQIVRLPRARSTQTTTKKPARATRLKPIPTKRHRLLYRRTRQRFKISKHPRQRDGTTKLRRSRVSQVDRNRVRMIPRARLSQPPARGTR